MALVSIISCVSLRRVTARKERDPTDDSPNLFLLENPNLIAEEKKGREDLSERRGGGGGREEYKGFALPPFSPPRLRRERGVLT